MSIEHCMQVLVTSSRMATPPQLLADFRRAPTGMFPLELDDQCLDLEWQAIRLSIRRRDRSVKPLQAIVLEAIEELSLGRQCMRRSIRSVQLRVTPMMQWLAAATSLGAAMARRLKECNLQMHPEKPSYLKDRQSTRELPAVVTQQCWPQWPTDDVVLGQISWTRPHGHHD